VNLLLDTHAFLWFVLNDPRLSATARRLLADPQNSLFLSAASYWELAIKISTGKYVLNERFDVFILRETALNGIQVLPITVPHGAAVSTLPLHHRDPFDRMLIAQAIVEQVSVVSADPVFDAYPVTRLW
jgi:PIN domain nuclease of toxin-antitoxin system